ncbi:hypothetical protein C8R43DRAFT_1009410 [Mycena crocata]|nr:hypothetical protein C8R43DRAFT_1009410 [Mycena crocata]
MAALSKCVAKFGLVDPKPSNGPWKAYFLQRRAAIARVKDRAQEGWDEEYYSQSEAVHSAVQDVLKCTGLSKAERKVIQNGILLLCDGVEGDSDSRVRSANVLSRIYSPTTPTAVDVFIDYWYRTRQYGVEFKCDLYYRVHNPVESTNIDVSNTPKGRDQMYRFRPLVQLNLAEMPLGPRWCAIKEGTFLSASEARMLHRVLFGTPTETSPGLADKVSMREMLRLLFASVGIAVYVASDAANEKDCDRATGGSSELRWEGIEGYARWLGRNIRKVADCAPMPRDGEDSDIANVEFEGSDEEEDPEEDR